MFQRMANSTTDNMFKSAVENTCDVKSGYCVGLKAIKNVDKSKIKAADTKKLDGSINIDSCVKNKYPNGERWDYAISYTGKVCYCEVHPAETSEVTKMLDKLTWLKGWLKDDAPSINVLPSYSIKYVWIPSGRVNILANSKEARRVACSGIFIRKVLSLK